MLTYLFLTALCFFGLMLILLGVGLALWIEDTFGFWWHLFFICLLISLAIAALIMSASK